MTMITLSPSRKAKTTTLATAAEQSTLSSSSSSSSFGFWSLSNSSSLVHSPTFSYNKKKAAASSPLSSSLPAAPIMNDKVKKKEKKKMKVSFQTQCQVRTFEVVALEEEFELSQVDDEDYWEQLGEDYWYQAQDFQLFKKERRTLVDRIRTIGVARAKGNYCMEGLEFFLTLQAREVHKDRVLDGWVSVLEVQADLENNEQDDEESTEDKVELIASKYALVSKDCIQDAHKRAMETAQEIQAEDDRLVASIPKSPQPPKKATMQQKEGNNIKVKALGVWGSTWGATGSNNSNVNSFSTFQKIRPFPRQ